MVNAIEPDIDEMHVDKNRRSYQEVIFQPSRHSLPCNIAVFFLWLIMIPRPLQLSNAWFIARVPKYFHPNSLEPDSQTKLLFIARLSNFFSSRQLAMAQMVNRALKSRDSANVCSCPQKRNSRGVANFWHILARPPERASELGDFLALFYSRTFSSFIFFSDQTIKKETFDRGRGHCLAVNGS